MKKNIAKPSTLIFVFAIAFIGFTSKSYSQNWADVLVQRSPLSVMSDTVHSTLMVQGIQEFLLEKIAEYGRERLQMWEDSMVDGKEINSFLDGQRTLLRSRLGIVGRTEIPKMNILTGPDLSTGETRVDDIRIIPVSWNAVGSLTAEGYLILPDKEKVKTRIILIPDADNAPEVFVGFKNDNHRWVGLASKLARQGCEVLVLALANREDTFSGSEVIKKYTNQPHREWLYRKGFELGRTIIGYELQEIFSAVNWFKSRDKLSGRKLPIGVMGYGTGGLLALHAGALDTAITVTLVSGYFNTSDSIWKDPIYRNTFRTLRNTGNAELAVMNWPRTLIIEHSKFPQISGPPLPSPGRTGAAPGRIVTPDFSDVQREWKRAEQILVGRKSVNHRQLINAFDRNGGEPFSGESIKAFGKGLNLDFSDLGKIVFFTKNKVQVDEQERQERIVRSMETEMERVYQLSEGVEGAREHNFWKPLYGAKSEEERDSLRESFREQFWEVLGRLPDPTIPPNTRMRFVEESEKWKRYEVEMDVWPHVITWGLLTVPKNIKPGNRLPVVVCQHGLSGSPYYLVDVNPDHDAYHYYKGFASTLADEGYITYAPANPFGPYDGASFREINRMANPIGYSLFSIIIGQNQRFLQWLKSLEIVDSSRIGFYGLSYGGKTAMRVPAVLKDYALSIASGDFNQWVRKVVSTSFKSSYMFVGEYEMPEWNLAHTFDYAEMAALIAPRPFMVERGYLDGVALDTWVGYEYAKVRRFYDMMGIGERTRIEYFNGPHQIHGIGTYQFLNIMLKLVGQ